MQKVVLGLSGGVDSAASAILLKEQGYAVTGLFLDVGKPRERADAQSVAEQLGIPLIVQDAAAALEREVCDPFADGYLHGRTVNPCIICNPAVKFRALCGCADRIGAELIATGHYARAIGGNIYRACSENDQSYMLCRLLPEQTRRLLLPLGTYTKSEIRAIAEENGITVARKPDSMEICFVPDNDYRAWLQGYRPMPQDGDFVFGGKILGTHGGIWRYTVGQRWPGGLYEGRKLYVSRIRAEDNVVELCLWEDLFSTEFEIRDLRFVSDEIPLPFRAGVRVRHTKWEQPQCTVEETDGRITVHLSEPVRAASPGQAAAFYQEDRLIGGAFIV